MSSPISTHPRTTASPALPSEVKLSCARCVKASSRKSSHCSQACPSVLSTGSCRLASVGGRVHSITTHRIREAVPSTRSTHTRRVLVLFDNDGRAEREALDAPQAEGSIRKEALASLHAPSRGSV